MRHVFTPNVKRAKTRHAYKTRRALTHSTSHPGNLHDKESHEINYETHTLLTAQYLPSKIQDALHNKESSMPGGQVHTM